MATDTGAGRVPATGSLVGGRAVDRAPRVTTLGTIGAYLDREGFGRAGLAILCDEDLVTVQGRQIAGGGGWVTRALPIAGLDASPARDSGFLRRYLRPPRLAPEFRALGALLDERRYLRRGLSLQFAQGAILVTGIALAAGVATAAYGHEASLTLLVEEADLAAYRVAGER